MPSSFRGQPNLFNLPKQNSPLAILDSSASNSASPRVTPCPSCDLWAPWVSTQALKPCLKGFPTSAGPREKPGSWMCIHRGHPLHPRPQRAGTRRHPRRGHREAWGPVLLRASDTEAPPHSQGQEEQGAAGQRSRCVNGGNQPAPAWAWGRLTLPGMVRVTSSPGGWGVQGWHAASSGQESACSSATRQMGTEFEREGK